MLTVPEVAYFDFNVDWRWEDGWLSAWKSMGRGAAPRGTMTHAAEVAIADTFAAQAKVFAANNNALDATFDSSDAAQQLAQVAMLIEAGIPSQTYVVTLGGFDTHGSEDATQPTLFGQLDAALGEFFTAIGAGPRAKDVFVYATSEFGRQQTANGSAGLRPRPGRRRHPRRRRCSTAGCTARRRRRRRRPGSTTRSCRRSTSAASTRRS